MKRRILSFSLFTSFVASGVTLNYSNTESGSNIIPLGYEVPVPVDSLTPVDGFRTYFSLNARHEQLASQSEFITQLRVGDSFEQSPIWAYQLSDSDSQMVSGGTEGSALINGGIHAREWQSPEATTGYMEYLFDAREDQYLGQYILENINLVVIPVLNVDGFRQTQRFPSSVTSSSDFPRDGRMRRKNMRDVDQNLTSLGDNLNGVDLNRNNNPYWATNNENSSSDVTSIVHHGAGAASESETRALQQGAVFAGEQRLRFYTDNHSFTKIYLTPMTGNSRRNEITTKLASVMRAANNFRYRFGPASAGGGVGATDEYFANTYQIPSYTLEIEPQNSGAEYGGFGPSHSGFILPNSEVERMRNETAMATMSGLYAVADIPFLMGMEVWDENNQTRILSYQWQATDSGRMLSTVQSAQLQAQTNYQMRLIFNKPMRWLQDGQIADFPSLSTALGINLKLIGRNSDGTVEWPLDSTSGNWLLNEGFNRYKTDTFSLPFNLADTFDWTSLSLLAVEVDTTDFSGQKLDTDPSSIVDWQNGAWTNYEDTAGSTITDQGGLDRSLRLIDDGSALFAEAPTPPNPPAPPPSPPSPPTQPDSGGGGSLEWFSLALFGVVALMRLGKAQKRRAKLAFR